MTMRVGAVMPIADEGGRPAPRWTEIRDVAIAAEAAGLDSIWVYDHLLFRVGNGATEGIHESWTLLAALAAVTERVAIGELVLAMPFRNPALLAKMAATADEVAGGRLVLGVGCGWHEPEFDAFGFPFDHRVARFEEALAILVPLLRSDGEVTAAGRYHRADRAVLLPRPPQRPDGRATMPILIAGKGPRMLSLVARHADAWNTAWLGGVHDLAPRVAPLLEALEAAGRDRATLDITVGVNVVFPDLVPAGEELPPRSLSGSVDEVAAGLRGYAQAGVAHVMCAVTPTTPASMERLAEAMQRARE